MKKIFLFLCVIFLVNIAQGQPAPPAPDAPPCPNCPPSDLPIDGNFIYIGLTVAILLGFLFVVKKKQYIRKNG